MITKRTNCGAAILIAVLLSIGVGARAQTDADVAAVMAANNAFYTAVSALDASAVDKIWSHEAYVTYIGPRSTTIEVGSAAVQDAFKTGVIARIAQMSLKPANTQVHINGNVALVVGLETSEGKLKDGTSFTSTSFVTHVFEKKNGHWLMVSQHTQRVT
jgi:ketosteroid isomerase-like protein